MPLPTSVKSNTGKKGLAEVQIQDAGLRVIFQDVNKDSYHVSKEGWTRPSGFYQVTLNASNDKIKFIGPIGRNEPYVVRFLEFSNRVGRTETNPGLPEMKIEPAVQGISRRNGKPYYIPEKGVFIAKLQVVDKEPSFRSLNIPYKMPWVFVQAGDITGLQGGSAAQNKMVEEFLTIAGNFNWAVDSIPWSPNVLPWLEFRLKEANRVFQVKLNERGFVVPESVSALPSFFSAADFLGDDLKAEGAAEVSEEPEE